jgi:superfamily I DNA/RNA helicase/RecB family exonuclease
VTEELVQPRRAEALRLVRAPERAARPLTLDESQRRVVEHRGGPLLVLAGPGTGKTATLVAAVADRVERDGLSPEQVLVLTFSRRAADELRTRLAARLQRTVRGRLAWTFHSWCYALVRRLESEVPVGTPRLLSGPEQDRVVRDLLEGQAAGPDRERWPAELRPLLTYRGFAAEVRELIARCAEHGLDPVDLERLGELSDRPAWRAAAAFYREYRQVLGLAGQVDYADLIRRAGDALEDPAVLAEVVGGLRLVVVDEYQDTDPAQERVLVRLAEAGVEVLVVGDPDQSIYAFRGADVGNILDFPQRFRRPDGKPARRLALSTCRRSGPGLVAASRRVATRIPLPGLPARDAEGHRRLASAPAEPEAAEPVSVRIFGSAAHEATAVADLLRRAHLLDGVAWRQMAVLVRSTRSAGPMLRALSDAGVPVETPSDEVPLAREAALAPLLTLLDAAVSPAGWDEDSAGAVLCSPLGGADALQLRRLRHELLEAERAAGGTRRSGELLAALLTDQQWVARLPENLRDEPDRVSAMWTKARAAVERGLPAEDVLWAVWAGSWWRSELERSSAVAERRRESGGEQTHGRRAASRHAEHQLDALVALFEAAARFSDRLPGARMEVFLDELTEQEIPADPLAQAGVQAEAVQVLTAHRSKGLEWDLVVVAGLQEGVWPDLRRRRTLLESDALSAVLAAARSAGAWAPSAAGDMPLPLPPPLPSEATLAAAERAAALADERRLFYVAATRARQRLVCTAVSGGDDLELRPSRLLHELGVEVPTTPESAPRVLALPALVAELRRVAADPTESDGLRRAAAAELAALADSVPAAAPENWWGLLPWTARDAPLIPADAPVALSPSQVDTLARCPLQWFLRRRAGVETTGSSSQGFGVVIHALAEHVVTSGQVDLPELERRLDEVWPDLDWDAPWFADREREVASKALQRFAAWHQSRGGEVIGVEVPFELTVGRALIRGQIDRLERDDQGRGVVIDYKTGRSNVPKDELREHPQLGLYQLAVAEGALGESGAAKENGPAGENGAPGDGAAEELTGAGGAFLLQLRSGTKANPQHQPPLEPDETGRTWVHELLETLVQQVVTEQFPARRNEHCDRCEVRRACPAQPTGSQVV